MENIQKVKQWLMLSYYGAVILGSVVGLLFGLTMLCILSATNANAHPVKTLTLDKDYVISGTRICMYSNGTSFDSVQIKETEKCKAVITVDAE